ncbi:large conductance mechanosensitive channel [Entomortierella parvispora]|uniref:Large conductance mechanosensitive channel n=1 Tax=Entomortierella parvispora TaxID=205924 RepID=A0A9P3M1V6_9FUNG|nr:large conductance mechanosensitive channel [Entomortierella parvispora]
MSNTPRDNGAYELDTPASVQQQDSFNEKTKKKSRNPAKAVTRGFTQGTQAVVGGVAQGTKVVRGGISQVEKGVNNVGGVLNRVPGVSYGVSFFADYRKFMDRGNVVDLAVAVVIGAAFTSIVTSLVTDIITPIIALASGKNLEENFLVLRKNSTDLNYPTRALAQAHGEITWNWGNFLQTVINFFIVSGCVFLIVKIYQVGRNVKTEVTEKACDFCLKKIPLDAVRCSECTTWLDWDACAKVAQLERVAAASPIHSGYQSPDNVDGPSSYIVEKDFDQTKASLNRF